MQSATVLLDLWPSLIKLNRNGTPPSQKKKKYIKILASLFVPVFSKRFKPTETAFQCSPDAEVNKTYTRIH